MLDLFATPDEIEILPVKKLSGHVVGTFAALGKDFVTQAVDALKLGFEGVERDIHAGHVRRSSSREPWYPRGTELRNERQLSIVAADELGVVAGRMGIAEIKAEWIGANLVLDGIPRLSMLPSGTLLFFENGVTIKVDAQNGPCKIAGKSIAEHAGMADVTAAALLFPKVAKRLRGLVAWVEKPGIITPGEAVSVRVPEQWVYRG
jgi:hypothetical protein